MWKAIEQQFGHDRHDVISMLSKEPAFLQYSRSVMDRGSIKQLLQ